LELTLGKEGILFTKEKDLELGIIFRIRPD